MFARRSTALHAVLFSFIFLLIARALSAQGGGTLTIKGEGGLAESGVVILASQGQNAVLKARATDASGRAVDLTKFVPRWETDNDAVSIQPSDGRGESVLVVAEKDGVANVTVHLLGRTATQRIYVGTARASITPSDLAPDFRVARLVVASEQLTGSALVFGSNGQNAFLKLRAYNANNVQLPLDRFLVTWATEKDEVVELGNAVDDQVLVIARQDGKSSITATLQGVSASVTAFVGSGADDIDPALLKTAPVLMAGPAKVAATATVIPAPAAGSTTAPTTPTTPTTTAPMYNANQMRAASTVATLTISPADLAMKQGETTRLSVAAKNASGTVAARPSIAWSTSDATHVQVAPDGLLTAVEVGGPVTITATSGTVTATANVSVSALAAVNRPGLTAVDPMVLGTVAPGTSRTVQSYFSSTADVDRWLQITAIGSCSSAATFTLAMTLTGMPAGRNYDLSASADGPQAFFGGSAITSANAGEQAEKISYSVPCGAPKSLLVRVHRTAGLPSAVPFTLSFSM